MKPPKTQNGPGGVATPARARNDQIAAEDTDRVQRGSDISYAFRPHPAVQVSLYAPHPGRRTWWFAYRCVRCGYGHQGQLRKATDEDSAHKALHRRRHTCCGRRVRFLVARVYRGQSEGAA